MKRSRFRLWLAAVPMLALACLLLSFAAAEPAEDITARCRLTPASGKKTFSLCLDRSYKTCWKSGNGEKACVEIALPEGETASGVFVQWYENPHPWRILVPDGDGGWTEAARAEGVYLADWLPLPAGAALFRVANVPEKRDHFNLTELRVYGAGDIPREVQRWDPPAEKADLMLLAAHPDDEVLWFGGALPRYAGEEGLACQVCILVPSMPYRRLELLDCLWTCGVRNYPVWGKFSDAFSSSLSGQYQRWSKNRVYAQVTEWIRRFQPDVLLTHDVKGEYGHGAHRVCADAAIHCLKLAAEKKSYRDSAREYGLWDVPKCYIHLWEENAVDMDWRVPLTAFGGKTGFEVAEEAFRCHTSQQSTDYHVEDWGRTDCSLFGLYRSLVGPDVRKDDFFENLR